MEKEKCKKCGSTDIVMVEYDGMHPDHYDGVSEIMCRKCGARFGRWSGKELAKGETEKRYGQQKFNK
ncbi:MAG: hypothetical protein Q8Q46_03780 [Candidatus Giovannonibacteria bacterium]|nr:hypothetical protein [Candidatus Giovannonibacteria bacterium]